MNYSLNAIAESIAERAGRQFDIPFREQVKLWVGLWRTKLMRDTLDRNPRDRPYFLTPVIMPLVVVKEFPTCGVVRRTACKIPDPLRANNILFDYVGLLNMEKSFPIVPTQNLPYLATSPFTGKNPKAAWLGNYIYIFNAPHLDKIRFHGIFEDVTELNKTCATSINGESPSNKCVDDDAPYPISRDIAQRVIQSILSVELRMPAQPNDTEINLNPEENDSTQKRSR